MPHRRQQAWPLRRLMLLALCVALPPHCHSVDAWITLSEPLAVPVHELSLASDGGLTFSWLIDYPARLIEAQVDYDPELLYAQDGKDHTRDWVAIGFSDNGSLSNADLCIFWTDWKGDIQLTDTHTDASGYVVVDPSQDCQGFELLQADDDDDDYGEEEASTVVRFRFQRQFDTCHDDEDYVIEDGTTHVVFATGRGPLFRLEGLQVQGEQLGFQRVRLLAAEDEPALPEDSFNLDVVQSLEVPGDDTTYWCSVHRLPREFVDKHHIVQYEPVKTPGNEHLLHHMEVFHCDAPVDEQFPMWSGPCGSDTAPAELLKCKKEAGLPIGGPDFNPYIMLEVHINNENMEKGVYDRSGMRLTVSPSLRAFDAGILELGLIYTDEMAIPPGQESFSLTGVCAPECSAISFPPEGIKIFGSQLHTHGTGIRVATRHSRDGVELPEVNRDNHYSTHFQEIRPLKEPRRVLPGDSLFTTCWFDTEAKENATVGGYSFADEMCLNYVHYYPKVELEICKSAVSRPALDEFFAFMSDYEDQATDREFNATENYRAIDWTPMRIGALRNLYDSAPLQMQCQSGDGQAMPGNWDQVPLPEILAPLPEPARPACLGSRSKREEFVLDDLLGPVQSKRMGFSPAMVPYLKAQTRRRMLEAELRRKSEMLRAQAKRQSIREFMNMRNQLLLRKRAGSPMNEMRRRKRADNPNELQPEELQRIKRQFSLRMKKQTGLLEGDLRHKRETAVGDPIMMMKARAADEKRRVRFPSRNNRDDPQQKRSSIANKAGFSSLENNVNEAMALFGKKRKRGVMEASPDSSEMDDALHILTQLLAQKDHLKRSLLRNSNGKSLWNDLENNLSEALLLMNSFDNRETRSSGDSKIHSAKEDCSSEVNARSVGKRVPRGPVDLAALEQKMEEAFSILRAFSIDQPGSVVRRREETALESRGRRRSEGIGSSPKQTLDDGLQWTDGKRKKSPQLGREARTSPSSPPALASIFPFIPMAYRLNGGQANWTRKRGASLDHTRRLATLQDSIGGMDGLFGGYKRKRTEDDEWSDYDAWGYDKRKRGLGSVV